MRYSALLLATACLLGGQALAQIDPDPDGIGFYADLGGMVTTVDVAPNVGFDVYLLATNISAPAGIAGWEMSLWTAGNVDVVGWTIPYAHVNVGYFPDFAVGVWPPLPYQPAILLMEVHLMVGDTNPAELFVSYCSVPPPGGSLHNYLPVYVNADDISDLRNLFPSSGDIDLPVLRINGDAPIAVEPVTWGNVKTLYRN
jgi:hypothetical protein